MSGPNRDINLTWEWIVVISMMPVALMAGVVLCSSYADEGMSERMTRQVRVWAPIIIGLCVGVGPGLAIRGTKRMRQMPDEALKPRYAGGGARGGVVRIVGGALLVLVGFLPEGGGAAMGGLGLIVGGITLIASADR